MFFPSPEAPLRPPDLSASLQDPQLLPAAEQSRGNPRPHSRPRAPLGTRHLPAPRAGRSAGSELIAAESVAPTPGPPPLPEAGPLPPPLPPPPPPRLPPFPRWRRARGVGVALGFARGSQRPERPGTAEDAVSPAWRLGSRSRPSGDVSSDSEDKPRSWGGRLQATTDRLRRAPDRWSSAPVSAPRAAQRCALPRFPLFPVPVTCSEDFKNALCIADPGLSKLEATPEFPSLTFICSVNSGKESCRNSETRFWAL